MIIRKKILITTTLLLSLIHHVNAATDTQECPDGIKFMDTETYHPVFGQIKIISHTDEIQYYDKNVKDSENHEELANNFIKYAVKVSSFKKIKRDDLKQTLMRIAESTSGMNMLKVITSNYMHEYDLLKQLYKNHENTFLSLSDTRKDLNQLENASSEVKNFKFKKEILEAKIARYENILERRYTEQDYHEAIGIRYFYRERVDDLIAEFKDENLKNTKSKEGYEKSKKNIYKQIKITIDKETNPGYYSMSNKIRLNTIPVIKTVYLDNKNKILPIPATSRELDFLEHELFHALNFISLTKIYNTEIEYCEESWMQKWTEHITESFKMCLPKNFGEKFGKKYKTIEEVLQQMYTDHYEMMAMYGITYYSGQIYYEPINEAVATTQIHYYDDKQHPVIRVSHDPKTEAECVQTINANTLMYKYYFINNDKLRDKITYTQKMIDKKYPIKKYPIKRKKKITW